MLHQITMPLCEFCGGFYPPRSTNRKRPTRFCSTVCRNRFISQSNRKPRPLVSITCEHCGTAFESPPAPQYMPLPRFCSLTCKQTHIARKKGRTHRSVCAHCGSESPWLRRQSLCQSCRRKLSYEQRQAYQAVPKRYRWSDDDIAFLKDRYAAMGPAWTASRLGKTKGEVQSKAHQLGLSVSDTYLKAVVYAKCAVRMKANNPMRRDSVKRRVQRWFDSHPDDARKRIERLTKGQQRLQRTKPSGLEKRMRTYLGQIGVSYEPSAEIKSKFIVDVRIGMLIIQADGEYWHGHPDRAPLSERQIRQQRRDRAQDAYLRKCGYTVVRIWERDMTLEHLQAVLLDHGVLAPSTS